jgi:hypothetical protein
VGLRLSILILALLRATVCSLALADDCPPGQAAAHPLGVNPPLVGQMGEIAKELIYEDSEHVLQINFGAVPASGGLKTHTKLRCFGEGKSLDPGCSYRLEEYESGSALQLARPKLLAELPEGTRTSLLDGRRISVIIALDNDSRMYSLYRVLSGAPHEDDLGYTHGISIDASITLPKLKDLKVGVTYTDQLFTQGLSEAEEIEQCRKSGIMDTGGDGALAQCAKDRSYQYYSNANRYLLSAGQAPLTGFRWNASAGFMQLDSQNAGVIRNGTEQQNLMHRLFGIVHWQNVENGKGVKTGFYGSASAGYQSPSWRLWNNRVQLSGSGEAEGVVSNLAKVSSFRLSEQGRVSLQSKNGVVGVGLSTGFAQKFHSDGVQPTVAYGGEFFAGPFVLRYEDTHYLGGKLYDFTGYNVESVAPGYGKEPIGTVFIMVDFNHWARRKR